jgi:endoglucanase
MPELTFEAQTLPETDAMKFTKDMRVGWNLGNAFDANDTNRYSPSKDLSYEMLWGAPKTTKALIDEIKAAGFNTVRMPNSWHNHVIDDKFTISKKWLDRYQEVVDYAYDSGMYVIINIHHDDDVKFVYPDTSRLESTWKFAGAIWKQVAERFKDYDERIIFEFLNEPRLKGTSHEWAAVDPKNTVQMDSLKVMMELNQRFVDLVRASGGKNGERYLMIPSLQASTYNALLDEFKLPVDTAKEKLIVSVHCYMPYHFVFAANSDGNLIRAFDPKNKSHTSEMENVMKSLYTKYTSKGIPVVIGEFGATGRNFDNTQSRVNHAAFVTGLARSYGITSIIWDNSGTNTNNADSFALIDRKTAKFIYPNIVLAMIEYAD